MSKSTRAALFLPLTVLMLSACGSTLTPGAPSAVRFDQVTTVPLQAGDTRASIETATGGKVLTWQDGGCGTGEGACAALVGLPAQTSFGTQSLAQTLARRLGRAVRVEHNRDAFSIGEKTTAGMEGSRVVWAGGSRVVWAGGSRVVWAGGSRVVWAGGTYTPVPENSGTWAQIQLQSAQDKAARLGEGVTVAVIDTGIDLTHPAFQGALTDPSTWQDYVGGDVTPQEEGVYGEGGYGHGTNVAGIVLQVAPLAKIMPIRVLGSDGSGDLSSVVQAIYWAADHGANVINLSLGTTQDSDSVKAAIRAVNARNVLVVSSAGNEDQDKITYPAAYAGDLPGVLSVGSVDAQDVKSEFSNYSGKLKVVTPGESVYAPAPENTMAAWSGTSMSSPMAAGALALALGQGNVSAAGLIGKLTGSADSVDGIAANREYRGKLGSGRLNVSAFVTAAVQ